MDDTPGRFPPPPEAQPPGYPPPPSPAGAFYPLDIGRVLQLTFSLFRFRWRAFIGAALIVLVPLYLVVGLAEIPLGPEIARLQQLQLDMQLGGGLPSVDFPWLAMLGTYALSVGAGIVGYLATATGVAIAAVTYAGGQMGAVEAVRATVRRAVPVLVAAVAIFLTVFVIVLIGALAGIVLILASVSNGQLRPGLLVFAGLIVIVATVAVLIFVMVRWTLAVQAIVLEGQSGVASLRRSWRLVSGSSWRVLGYVIVIGLLLAVVPAVVIGLVTLITGTGYDVVDGTVVFRPVAAVATSVLSGIGSAVLMPVWAIAMTLLYLDLRWRSGEQVPVPGATTPGMTDERSAS